MARKANDDKLPSPGLLYDGPEFASSIHELLSARFDALGSQVEHLLGERWKDGAAIQQALIEERATLNAENSALKKQEARAVRRESALRAELAKLRSQIERICNEVSKDRPDRLAIDPQAEEWKSRVATATEEARLAREEAARLRVELEASATFKESSVSSGDGAVEEFHSLELTDSLQQERDALQQSLESLQQERDTLQQSLESLQQERDTLQQSLESLQQERDTLQQSLESLQQERGQLQQALESLQQERDNLQQALESLQQERDTLQQERGQLQQERGQLQQALESLQQERDELERGQSGLTGELPRLRGEVENLTDLTRVQETEITCARQEAKTLQQQLHAGEAASQRRILELENHTEALETRSKDLKDRLDALETRRADLEQEIDRFNQERSESGAAGLAAQIESLTAKNRALTETLRAYSDPERFTAIKLRELHQKQQTIEATMREKDRLLSESGKEQLLIGQELEKVRKEKYEAQVSFERKVKDLQETMARETREKEMERQQRHSLEEQLNKLAKKKWNLW